MAKGIPHREYYGFSQFFLTTFILGFILTWSLLPDLRKYKTPTASVRNEIINSVQEILDLLPQRYWIIVFDCLVLMGMLFAYLGLWMYNEDVLTVPLNDMRTITDSKANIAQSSCHREFLEKYAHKETSGVMDLPISDVCRILYEKD